MIYVGLGNYQKVLKGTRHNIGYDTICKLYSRNNNDKFDLFNVDYKSIKETANEWLRTYYTNHDRKDLADTIEPADDLMATYFTNNGNYYLLPKLGMNDSGIAVKDVLNNVFNIHIKGNEKEGFNKLIIIVDDTDLPFGKLRFSQTNKTRHNGVKSVLHELGVSRLNLLRVGLGKPPKGINILKYVLGKFEEDDVKYIPIIMDKIIKAMNIFTNYRCDKELEPYIDKINKLNEEINYEDK